MFTFGQRRVISILFSLHPLLVGHETCIQCTPMASPLTTSISMHIENSAPTYYNFTPQLQQIIQEIHNLHIPTHNPTLSIEPHKLNMTNGTNSPKTPYSLPIPPLTQDTNQVLEPSTAKIQLVLKHLHGWLFYPAQLGRKHNHSRRRVHNQLNNIINSKNTPRAQNVLIS